ncbi:sulfite exporter TauE/SafE family protein [Actinomadura craniellae]|uniref:Probable membrane transporter protein n=1 Tax=Actinomadura craniellae TaxID=2231787 RepID=A0A365GY13_9ACTN|nr:sulfite exporter TauE/SafE family protein [Actinomadura craniellae]RAY11648.1 sulfite exporter TauE/SafE family protein [Actinomadura craniellae]
MSWINFLLVAGLAATAGAIVQSGVGLGLGLVAAPVVTLLFPEMMPGSLLIAAAVLPLLVLAGEAREADWAGLRWAFVGRLAGTPAGIWVVATLPDRALGLAVGAMVLVAVAVTGLSARVPRNRGTLIGAGLMAGAAGTATSIGGPPIALLYQRESGPRVRATLSIFFTVGALLSVLTLAAVDELPARQVAGGLALTPFVIAGFAVSGPFRRYLDRDHTRGAILAVTATSALVLIIRNML